MKVSQDLKMYKGSMYYPLCFDENLITYVKVEPADAFVIVTEKTDDAFVINGTEAEAVATICIKHIQNHMLSIDNMIVVDESKVNQIIKENQDEHR